jgi:CIC family chloride channel protein
VPDAVSTAWARVSRFQQRLLHENRMFLALTLVVGVFAGLSAVAFSVAIDRVAHFFFSDSPSPLRLFLVPVLVSLVTGALLSWVFPDARGSGVPQTEAAYHLHGGVIPPRVPIGKFITGVLCIGSGHSMGREGPSVQIGGGIASAIGQKLGLSPPRIRDLLAVGTAGALSAAFNTPVAAVIFTLEEIIGDMNASLIGSAVVASVASVVVERSLLGNEPLFRVPTYHLEHPAELLAYAVLGIVGGAISVAFCKGLLGLRAWFQRLPAATRPLQPAIGGVAIGLLIMAAPQVMGVGYRYVDEALTGQMALTMLVLLCGLKIVATIASYSSGNAGGIFAPSLYIGAMAGGAIGTIVHRFAPFPTAEPGAYALVGMGTLFAGIIRAPMTSVFMIFEVTQDYQIIVPLMVANLLAFAISKRFQPLTVYHALLQQDQIHLPSGETTVEAATLTAAEAMDASVPYVAADTPIAAALETTGKSASQASIVGTPDGVTGIVTAGRLADAMAAGRGAEPVAAIAEGLRVHVHPDHGLDVVFDRLLQSQGALPVVNRDQIRRVAGLVTLDGLVRALRSRAGSDRR